MKIWTVDFCNGDVSEECGNRSFTSYEKAIDFFEGEMNKQNLPFEYHCKDEECTFGNYKLCGEGYGFDILMSELYF